MKNKIIHGGEREKIMSSILLLYLINIGDVKVQLFHKGQPAMMSHQAVHDMGLAANAMRIVHGITEEEIKEFSDEMRLKAARKN